MLPVNPESLLLACKIGAISLPVALFWQAWTSRRDVQWMAPIAAGVPFGFGLILIFSSVIMYFSTCYPPLVVASAMAANNMLRYVMSSVFPLFTIQMYENMKIKWASTLFALICIVLVPTPWIFERWGSKLRHKSQFGFAAMMKQTDIAEEVEEELEGDAGSFSTAMTHSRDNNAELTLEKLDTLRSLETNISHPGDAVKSENSLRKLRSHRSSTSFSHADKDQHQVENHNGVLNIEHPDYDQLLERTGTDVISAEESSNFSSRLV